MKKTEIVRESNIGSTVELSNLELLVIKSKWTSIFKSLNSKKNRIDEETRENINHFNSFVEKFTGEVVSLEDAKKELFSSEEIQDVNDGDNVNTIVETSTSSYTDRTTNV